MKPIFASHLKCRDKGEHGQCDICYRLRAKIKNAKTKNDRENLVHTYSRHLLSQWLDRTFYWQLKANSRAYFSESLHFAGKLRKSCVTTSVLTLIQDGMDQSKLRLPRLGYKRMSKAFDKIFRPACHLVGTWIHGFRLNLNLSTEDLKKDSVTSIELCARALSEVIDNFGSIPLSIHLQQDNTYREGKNKYMMAFFLLLQILGVCRFASLGFCRVGHSHEDIDQCFGQIARLLMGKSVTSPDGMIAVLTEAMETGTDPGNTGRIRGSQARAYKLDETCCWKPFVGQTGVIFRGLRRVHYFRFCARKDLGTDVLDNVLQLEELSGNRFEPHQDDTFLITKRWLADTEVQRALCVVPAVTAAQIRAGYQPPSGVAPRRVIREPIRKNIEKTVPPCRKSGELTDEGAEYLLQWCRGTLPRVPRPAQYSVLSFRHSEDMRQIQHHPGSWQTPRRLKHFDVRLDRDAETGDVSDDSSDSNAELDLPGGFEP